MHAPLHHTHQLQAGFTLVELVIVIVALAVLSVYAAILSVAPQEANLPSQAEQLARDIRHLQMLAATNGQHLRLNATAGGYNVTCISGGPNPCNGTMVIDPATGRDFSVTLVGLTGPAALDFDSLGRPLAGDGAVATVSIQPYTLSAGSSSMKVTVSPITSFVSVTSP